VLRHFVLAFCWCWRVRLRSGMLLLRGQAGVGRTHAPTGIQADGPRPHLLQTIDPPSFLTPVDRHLADCWPHSVCHRRLGFVLSPHSTSHHPVAGTGTGRIVFGVPSGKTRVGGPRFVPDDGEWAV
jgi:hypothetical protein